MAIQAYVGIMGSGKTFEVASVVILGALRDGRRVVSNIAGLNPDEYKKILIDEEKNDPSKIGEIVSVSHEQILEETFFRTDTDIAKEVDSFIQPGDLVALDEIWRFWDGLSKPSDRFMNFVRMHRQFVNPESGLTCELVLITQDVMDIGRKVRAVIEQTYRMTKATAIGSTKRYRVDIFQGGKTRGAPLRQLFKTYESKYFALYQSHSQKEEGSASAKEKTVDSRGNILKGALFKIVLPVMLLVGIGAVYLVYGFFNPAAKGKKSDDSGKVEQSAKLDTGAGVSRAPDLSDIWRIVGWYSINSGLVVVLQDVNNKLRYVYNPPNVRIEGLSISVVLDGVPITGYSGGSDSSLIPAQ